MMTTSRDHGLTSEELRMLEGILAKLSGQGADLPLPLFRFMTEITATANVNLLVQDDEKGVLLAWRDDPFGTGWHVPGSIIRHREEITHRILACAGEEFGCEIDVADRPVALIQIFDDRGHSISLCYPSVLRGRPGKRVVGDGETPEAGDLYWFVVPPAPNSIPATSCIVTSWRNWVTVGSAKAFVYSPNTLAVVTRLKSHQAAPSAQTCHSPGERLSRKPTRRSR